MLKRLRFLLSTFLLIWFSAITAQDTISVTLGSNQLKDAYINIVLDEPDGESPSLVAAVWTYFGEYGIGRSLFGFDFTDLSDGLFVIDARLNLYHNPQSGHIGHSTIGGDNSGMIFRITEPWIEDSVTWANQPSTTNTNAILIPSPDSSNANFENIDITPIIKDMIRHPETSDGFMIKLQSEDALYRSLLFASSDHPNENLHPSIVITYVTELPQDSSTKLQPDGETGNDATVFSVESLSNRNDNQSLISLVWETEQGWALGRSYLNFDLGQINSEHTVTYAELSLYHDPNSEIEGHINNGNSNELIINRVVGDWSEEQISWDNQPSFSDENQVIVASSNIPNQDYLDIDVTDLVLDMINNSESSFGFSIRLADEATQNYNRNVVFASSDHENMELHPKLVIYTQDYSDINDCEEISDDLKVYPNPAVGIFHVQLPVDDNIGTLIISDNLGNVMDKVNVESATITIDLSFRPVGIYHLQYKGKKGMLHTKVVNL